MSSEGATTTEVNQGYPGNDFMHSSSSHSEHPRPQVSSDPPSSNESMSPPELRAADDITSPVMENGDYQSPNPSAVYRAEARVFPNERASQVYNEIEQKLRADGVSTDHVVDNIEGSERQSESTEHDQSAENISYQKHDQSSEEIPYMKHAQSPNDNAYPKHDQSIDNVSYTKSDVPSNFSAEREAESPDLTSPLVMADQERGGSPGMSYSSDTPHNHSMYDEDMMSEDSYTPPSSVGSAMQMNPSPGSMLSPRGPVGSPWNPEGQYPGVVPPGFQHMVPDATGKEIYYCHLCSYSGNSKFHFNSHMNSHFEHRCPHCDYTSRTEGRLKRHIKDFHSDDPPDSFSGQPRHIVRTPGRPKVFRCKQCEFTSVDKIEFWEHSRKHIKADKVLQCPKCPFVTEYKHHLEYHLRNHFGSKPFKCPKCNYSCVNKSMLNSHLKSHSNVYQYRCADCTYATKYCHSLKLHLRKYNHKPATVLTTDGSLPMDGSGDFNLVAKRGPPRGPRGMKSGQESKTPPQMPIPPAGLMNMPQMSKVVPPHMNARVGGMMPPFWNLMHMNGMAPPPLIPMPGMMHPSNEKMFAKLAASLPLKCTVCEFVGESREALTEHMLKVHAAGENSDLLRMFNVSSDSLMEEAKKAAEMAIKTEPKDDGPTPMKQSPESMHHQASPRDGSSAPHLSPHAMYRSPPMEAMRHHLPSGITGLNSELESLARMTMQLTKAEPRARLPIPQLPPHMMQQQRSPAAPIQPPRPQTNSEAPLDLTAKPRDDEQPSPRQPHDDQPSPRYPHDMRHQQEAYSSGDTSFAAHMLGLEGLKRARVEEKGGMSEGGAGFNSASSSGLASPPARKRSRKGKAYKLDTLCLRLQERGTNSPEASGDEEPQDAASASASHSSTSQTNTTIHASNQPSAISGSEAESDSKPANTSSDEPIDYNEIHNSLSQLNNESPEVGEKFNLAPRAATSIRNPLSIKNAPKEPSAEESAAEAAATEVKQHYDHRKSMIMRHKETEAPMNGHPHYPHTHPHLPPQHLQREPPSMGDVNQNLHMLLASSKFPNGFHPAKNGGRYECSFCHLAFLDCVMYTMHMGYHSNRDPFRCNMCGVHTKDKVEFFLHIARAAHA
nr:Hunchback [Owenia fusiformis]